MENDLELEDRILTILSTNMRGFIRLILIMIVFCVFIIGVISLRKTVM